MTGGDGRAAGSFTATNVPAPLGDSGGGGGPPGLMVSKAFFRISFVT